MNLTGDPWLQHPGPIVAGSKIGLEVMPVGSMTLSDGAVQENARRPADLLGCGMHVQALVSVS